VHSRVGGGHLSAARALATELEATGRCTARLVDAYVDSGRWPVTRFPTLYAKLARHHPLLWSLLYSSTSHQLMSPSWVIAPFLRRGLRRRLRRERPDVVVSALPVVNGLLAGAAAKVGARLEVVLTDWHSVHPFWQAHGVDYYTTPTESARADCIRFGAPPGAIDVVGIPIRREFAVQRAPGKRRDGFTVLAMVGAEGSPRALRNIAALASSDLDAQLIVVCGRNSELRQQVEQLPARLPLRLKTLGFVEDVAELMRSADVLVTKAGGLTLAEAFCCRVPVVIHDVLAGQEAGNLEYVLAHDAVEYALTPAMLVRAVGELASDPARRARLVERGAALARPDAARQIAANVLRRLEKA
jgi:UDP-N-acetylglucosamine:LPS N-acetylglucosamine transferase